VFYVFTAPFLRSLDCGIIPLSRSVSARPPRAAAVQGGRIPGPQQLYPGRARAARVFWLSLRYCSSALYPTAPLSRTAERRRFERSLKRVTNLQLSSTKPQIAYQFR